MLREILTEREMRALPKVEFHRHLDGSVRFDTILDIAKSHNIDLGTRDPAELKRKTRITTPMESLDAVLTTFWTTQKVLASYESIRRITFENVEDGFYDGVVLLELRFAPVFIAHNKEIGYDEILEGVIDGVSLGMERYPVQVGIILIVPRSFDPGLSRDALDTALRYKNGIHRNGDRLCGFDLADAEDRTDPAAFTGLVEHARKNGLGITVHTGENTSADHVRRALAAYKPDRIGHGIRIRDDDDLVHKVIEEDIHLEISPYSNYLTRSVPSLEEHPLPYLYRKGVQVSINSDDPCLMDIDLVHEYQVCQQVFDLRREDFLRINRDSVSFSFLPEDIQDSIMKHHFSRE